MREQSAASRHKAACPGRESAGSIRCCLDRPRAETDGAQGAGGGPRPPVRSRSGVPRWQPIQIALRWLRRNARRTPTPSSFRGQRGREETRALSRSRKPHPPFVPLRAEASAYRRSPAAGNRRANRPSLRRDRLPARRCSRRSRQCARSRPAGHRPRDTQALARGGRDWRACAAGWPAEARRGSSERRARGAHALHGEEYALRSRRARERHDIGAVVSVAERAHRIANGFPH